MRESLVARGQQLAAEYIQSRKSMDPCTPRGFKYNLMLEKLSPSSLIETNKYLSYLHPSGNFSECRSASLMLLQKGKEGCPYERCSIGSTFIPQLQGKFLATENFFHTSKFFGLTPKTFLSEMMVAGQQFCEEDWSNLKKKYRSLDEEDLHRYCFSSAYIVALLHDSLRIDLDDERIGYANQVNNIPLDWALGAFILQSTADLDAEHSSWIRSIICDDCSTFVVMLVFVLLLVVAAAYSLSKWRKPQVKTIYDLKRNTYSYPCR